MTASVLAVKGSAVASDVAALSAVDLAEPARIERGEYLATAGNCVSCHTTPGGGYMAGGLAFHTDFGTIYSTNITSDVDTGIGAWTQRDFVNAMRHGRRPNGEHLYPAFPYTAFARMRDDDLVDLYAYFRTVPAVASKLPANALGFPFNQRALLAFWKGLYLDTTPFVDDPEQSPAWNRGAYLVEAISHCSACHSPRNRLGAQQRAHAMSGGEYLHEVGEEGLHRPWSAPDISGSSRGLGLWSEEDLAAYLGSARNSFLESFGPMNEVIINSTRKLLPGDVQAMASYLKARPAAEVTSVASPDPQVMGRGRTVYNLHCGTCHLPTGAGDPEMAPRLNAGSLVVQGKNPASMINAILYAPEAPDADLPQKWRKPMEEFQYLLDDDEVAALTTFIRNSWDNRAGAVTPAQVARQR